MQNIDALNSTSKDLYIQVVNKGTFNSYFTVTYSYNNSNFNLSSKVLVNGDSQKININKDAINVVVNVYLVKELGQVDNLYTKVFTKVNNFKLLLKGTETAPLYNDITNPVTPEYYISLKNTASFIGKIFIKYNIKDKIFNYASKGILNSNIATLRIPVTATNIEVIVKVSLSNNSWKTVYNQTLPSVKILKLSISGTISNPVCIDITNQTSIENLIPVMKLTKTPDVDTYNVGDTVLFTVVVSNTSGKDANNIVLTDNIPNEASFISTSLTLDNISVDGSYFLEDGFSIPNMSVGDSHTITYEIVINSMPSVNPVENDPVINYDYTDTTGAIQIGAVKGTTTPFEVIQNLAVTGLPLMQLIKVPNKTMYIKGDTVTFTIVISNTNGGYASNILLTDNILDGENFLTNSLTLDDISVDGSNFLESGLLIPDMIVGDSHIVTYEMFLSSMPSVNEVKNNPVINYDYTDTTGAIQIGTLTGTTTPFSVTQNLGSSGVPTMHLTKSPDKDTYSVGDTVTFTIVVSNSNGGNANNIVLTDIIPSEASFIKASLSLDNISMDASSFINNGLQISNMSVGDSHTITYQMIINSMPPSNPIENFPVINYSYIDTVGITQNGTVTGKTAPFSVKQNGCSCCCKGNGNSKMPTYEEFVEYLKSIGYIKN